VQVPVTTPDGRELIPALHDVETPSEKIERRQNHETVRQLIAELPEDQREVIVLRIYAELSFKEIADLTGVSINTALGRMRYALLNLRKKISVDQLVLR
jgi:RNA polymerase sigma-70 factor (ECF subfamily)